MKPKFHLLAKFCICLALLFLISIIIGYYSVSNLNKSTQSLNQVYSNQLQAVNFARTVQLKLSEIKMGIQNNHFSSTAKDTYQGLLEDTDVVKERAKSIEGRNIIKTVKTKLVHADPTKNKVTVFMVAMDEVNAALEDLIEFESAHAFTTVLDQKKLARRNLVYTNTIYVIGLVMMAIISFYLLKTVILPLRRLTHDIQAFRDGKLDVRRLGTIRQHDEIGMARSVFKDMALTLNKNETELKSMVLKLRDTNEQLNEEVNERKKAQFELELTLQKMIKLSRQAGMFEVASELLHNLGNILNSVHTSIDVLGDIVNSSKLKQSIDFLLKNQSRNLKIEDENVKLIFDYLSQLSSVVENETSRTQHEVDTLKKKIENLTIIIQAQQKYAKPTNIIESVNLNDIVEESLAINEHILNNHGIILERHFGKLPEIRTDKYKIMQILVNFIVNAKQALLKGKPKNRVLSVLTSLDDNDPNFIRVCFHDNGIGIERENLTKIFQQTTSEKFEDIDGFGLHSSANIAEQLGGRIQADSQGKNRGASFTLYLPNQQ